MERVFRYQLDYRTPKGMRSKYLEGTPEGIIKYIAKYYRVVVVNCTRLNEEQIGIMAKDGTRFKKISSKKEVS